MGDSVFVCVTSRDGRVPQYTREAVDAAVKAAEAAGVRCLSSVATGPYGVALARNAAVAEFARSKCSHLLFVDDDVTVPPHAITRLVAAADGGTRVALGCYPGVKTFGDGTTRVYVVLVRDGGGLEDCHLTWPDGVVGVQAGGAGCMLIPRGVVEKIPYPWFRFQGTYVPGAGIVTMGEDIDFCLRARAAGFPVVADGGVRCGHRKEVDLAAFL